MHRILCSICVLTVAAICAENVTAQTNSIQLRNGANYTTLLAPSGGNYTLTLPAGAGQANYVLTTNGSGTLSWAAASGGATSLDGLSDAKVGGTGFDYSMILGHQTTGNISGADAATLNTATGYDALKKITIGDQNTAYGAYSLQEMTSGTGNTALGAYAGYENSTAVYNTFVGMQAGMTMKTGSNNVGIGNSVMRNASPGGSHNTAIGNESMLGIASGSDNVAVGSYALHSADAGVRNIAIGRDAGIYVAGGSNNVLIGYKAGDDLTTGSGNVFIGYLVGSNNSLDTESDLLLIDNSNTTTPLIQGDFSTDALTFNGSVTTTGTSALNGDVTLGTGTSATGGSIIMHDNSTGDSYTATISSANLGASRAYTIPEAGADASFVMTEGAQTVNGAKTFGSAAVFNTSTKLKSNNGTGGVILQAGAMTNTNVTYTLPTADGTSGYVLTTNGSGTLSWAAASGGASAINDLTDAVKDITDFTGSMILGHQTTGTLSAAQYNTAVGMTAMDAITSGDENSVFGYGAGGALTSATRNTFVGHMSGQVATGSSNTGLGAYSLYSVTAGTSNVAVGNQAGFSLTTTSYSIGIGESTYLNKPSGGAIGDQNIAIGYGALQNGTTGAYNIMIGTNAGTGSNNNSSANNVALGYYAGASLTTGSGNVLIGYQAGTSLTTESNRLYIDNSNTSLPLIQGDFSADTLRFNGSTITSGKTTYEPPGSSKTQTATTSSGASAPDISAFTNTYEKVSITAASGGAGFVQLPTGTDGQVVYLRMVFTAASANTVTIVNSNNNNTAMVYDGVGADVIVAHMLYTTGEGWVIFSAIEYDN